MKKIIFTSLIAAISLSTFAQGKSGKNKNYDKGSVYKKDKDRDDDDRYEDRDKKNRNDKNDDDRNDDRRDNRKYSKNTPRKVSDAFRRDFPNATNVSWTKNTGTWTANFGGGGLIPNTRTVTYRANGQRISSNGIFR